MAGPTGLLCIISSHARSVTPALARHYIPCNLRAFSEPAPARALDYRTSVRTSRLTLNQTKSTTRR
jgi:hypothetical protein